MTPESSRRYHEMLARLIEHVLRCPSGPIRVPELAAFTGFSRFHLARLFREVTEETLDQFLRRVRLERAAYALQHTDSTVLEASLDGGYRSPEAFSRAFRAAFGVIPTEYRRTAADWKLPSPSDLHWNCHWVEEERPELIGSHVVFRPAQTVAVWRVVGNYARLAQGWERLREGFKDAIPSQGRFVTVYLDNMWTHPTAATLRADLRLDGRAGRPDSDRHAKARSSRGPLRHDLPSP